MKIYELEINKVRGIPYIKLFPNYENLVIWGPNGSGKSAVVDAIDFLLTGKILRLTGEGTKEISIKKHGPHIDYKPNEASVRAIIKLPNSDEKIEIIRKMSNPTNLICDEKYLVKVLKTLNLAQQGQHILSRREILKFITSEPKTRAEEIQDLLNINMIENYREAFKKVQNHFQIELKMSEKSLLVNKSNINAIIQINSYSEEKVLQHINEKRNILKESSINELKSEFIRATITYNDSQKPSNINVNIFKQQIDSVIKIIDNKGFQEILNKYSLLINLLTLIKNDSTLLKSLRSKKLIELGIQLIDDTGVCPLCDTSWPKDSLKEYLNTKIKKAEIANSKQKELDIILNSILEIFNTLLASINYFIETFKIFKIQDNLDLLSKWKNYFEMLKNELESPFENILKIKNRIINLRSEISIDIITNLNEWHNK